MSKGYGKLKVPYLIFILQRIWRRNYQIYYWLILVAIRSAMKRYFIFRSCPDWFVWFMADQALREGDDSVQRLFDQAYKERQTRRISRKRFRN